MKPERNKKMKEIPCMIINAKYEAFPWRGRATVTEDGVFKKVELIGYGVPGQVFTRHSLQFGDVNGMV